MRKRICRLFVHGSFCAILLGGYQSVNADITDYLLRNVRLTGQSSLYGEAYDIQGMQPRRDPGTARLSLRSSLYFTPSFSMAVDLLASTESSHARQDMNFLGLHPQWTWGRAHAGDYSEFFSPLSYNGINVRGGFIDIHPKKWRLAIGGGQTHRAVDGNVIHQAYSQYLVSSKIGYGQEYGSFFDLIFTHVKDDAASLSRPDSVDLWVLNPDTLETELDTIWVEPPYNPVSLTPQENSIAGFNTQIQFFDNRVEIDAEAMGSFYTKDLTAANADIEEFDSAPALRNLFSSLFSVNQTSRFDYAYHTGIRYKSGKTSLAAKYRYIGPGYVSLALPSFINDRRQLTLNSTWRFRKHRFRMGWDRRSDNLLGQKQSTNTRNQLRASVNSMSDRWRSSNSASMILMGNEAQFDSLDWNYDHFSFSSHQALVFDQLSSLRQIGLQYTFQTSLKNMAHADKRSRYHTLNLTSEIRLSQKLRCSLVAGLSHRDSGAAGTYMTQVYSMRASHTAFENRLISSLFSSSSLIRDNRLVRTGITSTYRLTQSDQILFTLYYNNFQGSRTYNELRTSLMLTHRL
jgi:hypothetical protein